MENILYDGVGTLTGNALDYVASMIYGDPEENRFDVADLAIVITDGQAQDNPGFTVQVYSWMNKNSNPFFVDSTVVAAWHYKVVTWL